VSDEELVLFENWRTQPKIWSWELSGGVLAILDQQEQLGGLPYEVEVWLMSERSWAPFNARLPEHAQASQRRRYLGGERVGVDEMWVDSRVEARLGSGVKDACVAQGGRSDTVQ
jgi:hypothetical protein